MNATDIVEALEYVDKSLIYGSEQPLEQRRGIGYGIRIALAAALVLTCGIGAFLLLQRNQPPRAEAPQPAGSVPVSETDVPTDTPPESVPTDGAPEDADGTAAAVKDPPDTSDSVRIAVVDTSFTLENAEGETLVLKYEPFNPPGLTFSGSMEVLHKTYTITNPAQLILHVRPSASFRYVPGNPNYAGITYYDGDWSASIRGGGLELVEINAAERSLSAEGSPKTLNATIETGTAGVYAHLTGDWTGAFRAEATEDSVIVRDPKGDVGCAAWIGSSYVEVFRSTDGGDLIFTFGAPLHEKADFDFDLP